MTALHDVAYVDEVPLPLAPPGRRFRHRPTTALSVLRQVHRDAMARSRAESPTAAPRETVGRSAAVGAHGGSREAEASSHGPKVSACTCDVAPPASAVTRHSESTLLAAASHDLRQPLQAIGLWIEILRSEACDQRTSQVLAKISDTARGLESVLESLLDISKLDMRRVDAHLADFAVSELLERLATTFTLGAEGRGLHLRVRPSSAMIHSDPLLLERLLTNFASNAVRYTELGGVLIGCRERLNTLSIEVWDTGPGIPADHFSDIFEEFVQLQRTTLGRDRGAGLGLSIVKRIAALLSHKISVTSRVGRGSCFRVEVPLASFRVNDARLPLPCSSALPSDVCGAFVVLIDDEPAIRDAMRDLFDRWGCHAVVAASTSDALRELAVHLRLPDVLISDYRLMYPETGLDAIHAVRVALGAPIPAALISGERCSGIAQASETDNIVTLSKPIQASALRALIAQHCVQRRTVP